MGPRCFVPECRENYENGPRVRVYSFPADEELKKKWIRAIPRPTKSKDNEIFKGKYDIKILFIQGVLLPDRQTFRGDSRHEDKHY